MKSRTQGFTLLELLVALGVAVILFSLLFIPMLNAMDSLSQAQTRSELQRNAQLILSRMTQELEKGVLVSNNDAPRTTVLSQELPVSVDMDGDGVNETYSTLQVTDASGFEPGMPVIFIERNASGVIQYQEGATIIDISEPAHDPGVCAPPGGANQIFRNIPPNPTLCPPVNTLLVGTASNTNNKQLQNTYSPGADVVGPFPYIDSAASNRSTAPRVGLTSRLDFILPAGLTMGIDTLLPLRPETALLNIGGTPAQVPVIITYYVRKREPALPYDPIDNPLLLYRAQYVPRLGPGATLNQRLSNGCWRLDSVNFADVRGNANDFGCDPFNGEDSSKGPIVLDPAFLIWSSHNTLVPVSDVDLVGRCLDGSDPTTNPDCLNTGSQLVTDTNFLVHREGGRTRVTINLILGRFDRGKSKFHRVQMRTDVDVSNSRQ